MKPITLKIKGLNSFIQEQVIDFEQLTKFGLFGIFGKTGSGKSTILDAMTLALYGVISRGTKQFINSNSSSAIVNFEFSVVDRVKGERVIYKVERTFMNSKSGGIRNSSSRISDITDHKNIKVLESKVKEVNKKCFEIINLTISDFFRTVVIPQGKFSEFLELENKPRRDMLEHLFNLEEYGDILENKIKIRQNKVSNEIEVIKETLNDINILTPEQYTQLKVDLDKMDLELKSKIEKYNSICEEYKSIEENRKLQEEEVKITENIKTLESQRDSIDKLRETLKVCEKARVVEAFINNKNKLQRDYITATENLSKIKQALADLEDKKTNIFDSFSKAEKDKNQKVPELIDRKSKLEQAVQDEKTLNDLISAISKIQAEIKQNKSKKEEFETTLKGIVEQQSILTKSQEDLQKQITENNVSTELKSNVVKGVNLVKDLKDLEKALKKQVGEREKVNKALLDLQKQLETLNNSQTELNTKIGSLSISKTDEIDAKKLEELKERLKTNKDLHQQNEINKSITALKDACHLGEPCPVCGKDLDCLPEFCEDDGNDYKKVISDIEAQIDSLNEEMKNKAIAKVTELGKLEAELTGVKTNITNTQNSIEAQNEKLGELIKDITDIEKDIDGKTKELEEVKKDTQIDDFDKMAKEISTKEKAKENLEPMLEKTRIDLGGLSKQIDDIKGSSSKIDNEISGLNGQLETKLGNQNLITDKLKEQFGDDFDITGDLKIVTEEIQSINSMYENAKKLKEDFDLELKAKEDEKTSAQSKADTIKKQKETADIDLSKKLEENGFENEGQASSSLMAENVFDETNQQVKAFDTKFSELSGGLKQTQEKLNGVYKTEDEWTIIQDTKSENERILDEFKELKINKFNEYNDAKSNLSKFAEKTKLLDVLNHKLAVIEKLRESVGSKRLVEYIAIERLKRICLSASNYLLEITDNKYELRTDPKGNFVRKNGTVELPVSTLSGGEKFTTSLALALALSTEIQKRAGTKMELFFLDEGFGSLDEELAEKVMDSIAKIPNENMNVGIISHVENIKDRVPAKLLVESATNISGSTIRIV